MPTETITAAQRQRLRELLGKRDNKDNFERWISVRFELRDLACDIAGPLLDRLEELERVVKALSASPEELADVLERWDQTDPVLQRQIVFRFSEIALKRSERIEELKRLLRPLALQAERCDESRTMDDLKVHIVFKVSDCRAARAALEGS
jgi:hypothetical protein